MITETDESGWEQALDLNIMSMFFHPKYINTVVQAFKVSQQYLLLYRKDVLCLALVVYAKNGSIVMPEHFSYTPIWISDKLDERKRLEVVEELIVYLKKNYKKVILKLDIGFNDLRAFIWGYFKPEIRYTYIKRSSLSHHSIAKNLKHNSVKDYTCTTGPGDLESIDLNLDLFKRLGYSVETVSKLNKFFISVAQQRMLYGFKLNKGSTVLGCSLIFIDRSTQKASIWAVNPVNRSEKYAHTFLYQYAIDWLFANGIAEIDFCGANMKDIASFKSYFNPDLVQYAIVRYSPLQNKLQPILNLIDKI